MTTVEHQEATALAVGAQAVRRRRNRSSSFRGNWWRHVVAVLALLFALFPVAYVTSAAFNADQSLTGASLIPRAVTFDNFRALFNDPEAPYLRWLANSIFVAGAAAFVSVLLGASAAYAFSRFRFRGRRMGLVSLLLIQMFPQFLALVAIYLILLRVGDVFPRIGLNTPSGLILVYLGGAMGLNVWLMKGFFDRIPIELDESARVDGATPAQIFWGVVLPLALPILAVVGIISFVFTLNDFILASALLQTKENFTLAVGLQGYIDQQYAENWGPFAAGVVLAAIPVVILVGLFQRFFIHGLTQGSVKG